MATATTAQSPFSGFRKFVPTIKMEPARSVIDVEEDGGHGTSNSLVPFEPDSPSKRAKRSDVLASTSGIDQTQLVTLIQSTIQESVASSLAPMQVTVQSLVEKSAAHEGRLDFVDHALESQNTLLRNMDVKLHDMALKHASRMDSFQGEIVDLQKALSSPKTAPSPSSLGPAPSGVTFDLVIGGWKEGSTRDWVERELGKLLGAVGVEGDVVETRLFGKRPAFAKLILKIEGHWGPAQCREFQLGVLTRLRASKWTPDGKEIWMTTDKTPKQRRVSKAIAQLNAFLHLKVDRNMLEVASWAAPKRDRTFRRKWIWRQFPMWSWWLALACSWRTPWCERVAWFGLLVSGSSCFKGWCQSKMAGPLRWPRRVTHFRGDTPTRFTSTTWLPGHALVRCWGRASLTRWRAEQQFVTT